MVCAEGTSKLMSAVCWELGCHPWVPHLTRAAHTSTRQVEVPVPHPQGQRSAPTPLLRHREPPGPFLSLPRGWHSPGRARHQTGANRRQHLLGKEAPGADDELEHVLQGLEGAQERLAGLPPARVLHVLRQHREQLPAGWGHVARAGQDGDTRPAMGRMGTRGQGSAEQPRGSR